MKRDLDLIRYILAECQRLGEPGMSYFRVDPPAGRTILELGWHIDLLIDAGLVEADKYDVSQKGCHVRRLTWVGHEFLDAAGDDSLWVTAKKRVVTEAGAWTFSLLFEYLKQEGRDRLGLPIP